MDSKSSSSEEEEKNQKSCTNCHELLEHAEKEREREKRKLRRLRKKPDQLRKELFEIVLRKRIFLTDRFEKIEKVLIISGIISEKQLANQQMDMQSEES